MNIKKIIDKNGKSIFYGVLIIVFGFIAIKSSNSYYEKDEAIKRAQVMADNEVSKVTENNFTESDMDNSFSTESKSIPKAIKSFINYCNNRELENAYKMLTDECKNAMFSTVEEFEKFYINNVFDVTRTYELEKWSTEEDKVTYLVTLYGDILATGGTNNHTQEYYTVIKNSDGVYRLNINNYIYGENRNIESTSNGIKIKIGNVDIYEEYEVAIITITNNTSKTICINGNSDSKNIYLLSSNNYKYSPLNSLFGTEDIVLKPGVSQTYEVEFNRTYTPTNKEDYLILNNVILDYEEYLNSDDQANYSNMTVIRAKY